MARAAVAGQGADPNQRPGLGPATSISRGRSCDGRRSPPRPPAGASASRVRRRRNDDSSRPAAARPGAARLGLSANQDPFSNRTFVPSLRANFLTLREPRRVVPLAPRRDAPRRLEHLGEEVVALWCLVQFVLLFGMARRRPRGRPGLRRVFGRRRHCRRAGTRGRGPG